MAKCGGPMALNGEFGFEDGAAESDDDDMVEPPPVSTPPPQKSKKRPVDSESAGVATPPGAKAKPAAKVSKAAKLAPKVSLVPAGLFLCSCNPTDICPLILIERPARDGRRSFKTKAVIRTWWCPFTLWFAYQRDVKDVAFNSSGGGELFCFLMECGCQVMPEPH